MKWHGKYLHDNRNLWHFNFNISKDKGNFTGTVQKIYPLLLLIVPGLNGSHVSVVSNVTVKKTLWNVKVLNANTPPRWKLTLLGRTNIWAIFFVILQYIIVFSSHILVLCTCLPAQGSACGTRRCQFPSQEHSPLLAEVISNCHLLMLLFYTP